MIFKTYSKESSNSAVHCCFSKNQTLSLLGFRSFKQHSCTSVLEENIMWVTRCVMTGSKTEWWKNPVMWPCPYRSVWGAISNSSSSLLHDGWWLVKSGSPMVSHQALGMSLCKNYLMSYRTVSGDDLRSSSAIFRTLRTFFQLSPSIVL